MNQDQKVALELTKGWRSELDLWLNCQVRNGWGRFSELKKDRGFVAQKRNVYNSKGHFSHLERRATKAEYKRVFGRK